MKYEEVKNAIVSFMLSNKKYYFFTPEIIEKLDKFYKKIFYNIEKENKKLQISKNELIGLYEILKNSVLFSNTSKDFTNFISANIELIINYLNNYFKNEEKIYKKYFELMRINQLILNFYELLILNKQVVSELKKYINYKPPSIELAKHYLESLNEFQLD